VQRAGFKAVGNINYKELSLESLEAGLASNVNATIYSHQCGCSEHQLDQRSAVFHVELISSKNNHSQKNQSKGSTGGITEIERAGSKERMFKNKG
jgi:hypothetical protein